MFSNAVNGFQNNRYHSQEIVGSLFVAALVKLGSKHIQQITNLTAFASAANGASVVVTAKSAHTLFTSTKDEEKSAANKALLLALLALTTATVTTLLRGTTILKTRHTSLPALSKFAKPLVAATVVTAALTEGGIRGIKAAHGAVQTYRADRAAAAAAAKLDAAKLEIAKEAFDSEDKIQALTSPELKALADAMRLVLGSATDKATVSDDQIARVNAAAEELNKAPDTTIADWAPLDK